MAEQKSKKYDGGKSPVVQGCFHYFPRALKAIADVSAYGSAKYNVSLEEKNWAGLAVPRLTDADGRHLLDEAIDGPYDPESELLHAAHHAWEAVARLEPMLAAGVPLRKPVDEAA